MNTKVMEEDGFPTHLRESSGPSSSAKRQGIVIYSLNNIHKPTALKMERTQNIKGQFTLNAARRVAYLMITQAIQIRNTRGIQ